MLRFLSFVKKEFYHILRDKRTLLILLVMPVVQIILFGFALSTEIKDVRFAAYDPSKDEASQRIISQLDASEYFTFHYSVNDYEQINDLLVENKVDMVIVFEDDFYTKTLHSKDASIQIIVDGSNTNTATMSIFYASHIISALQKELAEENMIHSPSISAPTIIDANTRLLYNPQMKSAFTFVPGVLGMILMLICAMMTSVAIVREKERGTMEVLLVSPINAISIILSKTVPYLVITTVNLVTIILLSVYLLDIPAFGNMGSLLIVSMVFIAVSLSLGILISTLVKSQMAAMLISGMVLMLPTMMLSGMIFPVESMPKILQWVSAGVPASWYIIAVKSIMIQGLDITYVLKEVFILFGFIALFISISLMKFKNRLS